MEEEQFFVPDYGEDLQTEGGEGDESLTEGVEIRLSFSARDPASTYSPGSVSKV